VNVIGVGLGGMALQLAVGLLVWWLRLRWQFRVERLRGQSTSRLAVQLGRTGGRLREQRADGSVIDLTVTGPEQ
jgi:hypothetical protein